MVQDTKGIGEKNEEHPPEEERDSVYLGEKNLVCYQLCMK